ncbi:MAG: ABC transporter ATP-binding protein [Desulfobacteraceae bacterium]|nr:MAG: ABC transporter ATP-binding protein [Desulfobacteraceae bacterium]
MKDQIADRETASFGSWEAGDLVLKNIVKSFRDKDRGTTYAVHDVSLNIQKGSFVTLLGPSGCGKTTTLRIVAGFEDPDSGEIYLGSKKLNHVPAYDRNMPMVFQSYALFPHLTVFENIAYGLKIKKLGPAMIKNDVAMALQIINLTGFENRYPGELSGGQQQRVALARAIVLKPKIILFDEPLSNLDAKLRIQTRLEIKRIQQLLHITVLYVTHDQAEALSLSDVIVLMNKGRIEQIGSPAEIYNKPRSVFVADFIGNSNFIDAKIKRIERQAVIVSVEGQELEISKTSAYDGIREEDEIYLATKPDAIQVNGSPNGFKGTLLNKSFLGSTLEYEIKFGESYITSIQSSSMVKDPQVLNGDTVYFNFNLEFLNILKKE